MQAVHKRLIQILRRSGLTVASAESCTGGGLAKWLTDPAGSSQWFVAGWVCYSNAAKERDLGVKAVTLRRHGAVSSEVVRELATGALKRSSAALSVAISGIAGPTGAVPGKPIGTVCFAFALRAGRGIQIKTVTKRFRGDRLVVRAKAVEFAMRGLYSSAREATLYTA